MSQITGNHHGTVLENQIGALLESKKYLRIVPEQQHIKEMPWYIPQFRRNKTLYKSQMRVDFLIYHPQKWPGKLQIECKWQSSTGTVDEKFPYLVLSLKQIHEYPAAILLAGGGYRPGAVQWLLDQQTESLIVLEGLDKIIRWANIEL